MCGRCGHIRIDQNHVGEFWAGVINLMVQAPNEAIKSYQHMIFLPRAILFPRLGNAEKYVLKSAKRVCRLYNVRIN